MAGPVAAVTEAWDKLTVFLYSQLYDERNWAKNKVSNPHLTHFFRSHFALILDLVLVPTIRGSGLLTWDNGRL